LSVPLAFRGEQQWPGSNMRENPSRMTWRGYAFEQVCLQHIPQIKEAIANAPAAPEYLTVDASKMEGSLVKLPLREQIPVQLEEQLVVEYYSR